MLRMAGKWFPVVLLAAGLAACDESPVSLPQPTSVVVPTAEIRLAVGDVTTLPTQVLDENGQPMRGLQASFVSDNPSVVSVDASGNVRAIAPGTATITSSYGSAKGTAKVTVAPISQPTSIAAMPGELRLTVGDLATLPAQVLDQNGQPVRGLQPSFSSDDPSVVSVDAAGNVRAVTPGTATITSSYGSVKAATRVTVTRNERSFVRTLDVLADSVVADVRGGTQAVVVRAFNGAGQTVCSQPSIQASVQVADRSVVDVALEGNCRLLVTPRFPGRTQVTVSADGVSDSFVVIVSNTGAVAFFSARPSTAQLTAGSTVSYSVRVLDEQGSPIAGRTVNFDVSAGRLSASRATTNAEGVATVEWVLPTNLRDLGSTQSITFSTQLPNGQVVTRNEAVFINGGALASVTLVRLEFNSSERTTPITGTSVTARTYSTVYLGARAEDQFGNPRVTDFTFTVTGPAFKDCPDFQEGGVEYTCIYASSPGTATFTATLPASGSTAAISRSVNVVFTN